MAKITNMQAFVTPTLEFSIPAHEVDKDVKVGDVGVVTIPVVIVSNENEVVTFRKTKNLQIEGGFRAETTKELRNRILDEQDEKEERNKVLEEGTSHLEEPTKSSHNSDHASKE